MPLDPQAVADVVVLAIKTALAPVLVELASLKAQVVTLDAMRERVVAMETKAAQPVINMLDSTPVDLVPVLERVAAAEALLKQIGDLRDRVVTVETKAAQPDTDLRDRVVTLEGKAAGPSLTDMALVDLRDRFKTLELRVHDDSLTKELGTLRERVAVVEVTPLLAGPAGKDGTNGKDGADGLGFDDLAVEFDGERTFALTFIKGEQRKSFPVTLPALIYKGVYQGGKAYVQGDTVTYGGHLWHCHEATVVPPGDASKSWQMCVRKGDQGKPGLNGTDLRPTPVVSVGGRS